MEKRILWSDKRRWFFGTTKLSFVKYKLSNDRLIVESGILIRNHEEVMFYRVMDLSMRQTLIDRFFGIGTVIVISSDKTQPKLKLEKIKDPSNLILMLSDNVEEQREKKNINVTEIPFKYQSFN